MSDAVMLALMDTEDTPVSKLASFCVSENSGTKQKFTFGLGCSLVHVRPQGGGSVLDQLPPPWLPKLLSTGAEEGGTADRQAAGHRAPPG